MKSPYVNELQPNQQAVGVFLVQSKEVRQKKTGDPYLSLHLADKSGELEAKMWDNVAEILDTFEREDFVKIKGVTQVFQNRLQLTIHKMVRVEDREVDLADFFPASTRNPDEMLSELREIVAGMTDPDYKSLLELFLADDDIARRYKTAPAAKTIHHAWLGGLLEHVLSMCALAKFTASHYPGIDRDLLLAGVFLHDIGKIDELSYERGFYYTDEGQLLGHITIGMRMLDDKLRSLPSFPKTKRTLLSHLILSHHGQLEFGSPKLPLFAEAMLLSQLDNLDSKMECMRGTAAKDNHVEGNWTSFSAPLDRMVLKKSRFLADEEGVAEIVPLAAVVAPMEIPEPARREGKRADHAQPQSSLFGEKLQNALGKDEHA